MTVYGYARVSTTDQASAEKASLPEQERRIRAYADMIGQSGNVVIFTDAGVSGSIPLDRRPSGIQMLATLKKGDTIVAVKLDRLFRSATDALSSVERFHEQEINVVLLDVSTEPVASSGVGKLFFNILASVAEFERSRIIERMTEGRNAKIARGGYNGGLPPYGFRAIGRGSHAVLAEHEGEQKTIQLIHDLRAEGRSIIGVQREMKARGYLNREGNPFWFEQIRKILMRGRPQREAAE